MFSVRSNYNSSNGEVLVVAVSCCVPALFSDELFIGADMQQSADVPITAFVLILVDDVDDVVIVVWFNELLWNNAK